MTQQSVLFKKSSNPAYATVQDEGRACTLSVLGVTYTVREYVGPWWKGACFRERRTKHVLNEVTMQLRSGEITAVLGNSGSGKTSLLDVISCRSSGKVKGHIYYNNGTCTRDVIKQRAAYVMQADRLLPNLTVRETLTFTARLKLPGSTHTSKINEKVTKVIMEMGLKDVADSRIGGAIIRGISGGEQRRVTIAIQLLKDPDMLFLDEPTSGLDSYTARYLVSNLRDLSRRGKIVLLTVHQPSSDIFHLFDQVCIMSQGELVYCGRASQLVPYFTDIGYPCDRYTNPLDRYVDVASIDRRNKVQEAESKARVRQLVMTFQGSNIHKETQQAIMATTMSHSSYFIDNDTIQGPSFIRVLLTVSWRMYKNLFRDRKDYCARIFLLPLFMVFILLFLGRLKHTQGSIQDRVGLIYQSSTVPPFISIINAVGLFPVHRDLYYREHSDGLYGVVTFVLAYTLHVLPFQFVSSAIFSSVVYWVTGMSPYVERFVLYTLQIFILQFYGDMVIIGFMGIFMNVSMANAFAALFQTACAVIASGLLKNINTLIDPLKWLCWILIHKYSAELFIANEFEGLELECGSNNISCLSKGDDYIRAYYPNADDNLARNFGAIATYAVVTMILAMVAFVIGGKKNLH